MVRFWLLYLGVRPSTSVLEACVHLSFTLVRRKFCLELIDTSRNRSWLSVMTGNEKSDGLRSVTLIGRAVN